MGFLRPTDGSPVVSAYINQTDVELKVVHFMERVLNIYISRPGPLIGMVVKGSTHRSVYNTQ